MAPRIDGRGAADLRPITIVPDFIRNTEGSVLIEVGETRVICTATVEESVPPFLRDSNQGWLTAEYGMLPGSSSTRIARESARGRVGGRTHEIQRLIGRSLRAVTALEALGSRTIWVDCDVIQADGGTRTASITGAYVAVELAVRRLRQRGLLTTLPVRQPVAAVSVGVIDGEVRVDLCYEEDSRAEVDMNVVMTGEGQYVEVQGTAEHRPFTAQQLQDMIAMAADSIRILMTHQRTAVDAGGRATK